MIDTEMALNKSDVTVESIDPEKCHRCGEVVGSHVVLIDLRTAGMQVACASVFCKPCAEVTADRIREGLPEPQKEIEE